MTPGDIVSLTADLTTFGRQPVDQAWHAVTARYAAHRDWSVIAAAFEAHVGLPSWGRV